MGRHSSHPSPEVDSKTSFRFFRSIKRGCVTLLIVLLILYAGVRLLSTTHGYRAMQETSLSERLNVPLVISTVHLDSLLRLHLTGLQVGETGDKPAATVDHVMITYNLRRGLGKVSSIHLEGVKVNLQRNSPIREGVRLMYSWWNPFAEVAGFYRSLTPGRKLNVEVEHVDAEWFMDVPALTIQGFHLNEREADNRIVLDVTNATLVLKPLDLPDRDYRYVRFEADGYSRSDGADGPILIEWIEGEGHAVELFADQTDSPSAE